MAIREQRSMDISGGIANPMIADVGGRFREGQERGRANLSREMVGEIIGSTFGGRLGALGKISPEAAVNLSGVLGIPANEVERQQAFFGNQQAFNAIINGAGPEQASEFLKEIIANTKTTTGQSTERYEAQLELLQRDPEQARQGSNALVDSGIKSGFLQAPQGRERAKTSAISERLPGGLIVQTDNQGNIIVTRANGQIVRGEEAQQAITAAEKLGSDQKLTEVSTQATARQRATRVSEIKKMYSERRRDAAREQIGLNQALKVVETADQGIQGQAKLQLSRIFTDIDVSDESQLDAALTGLSLDQLQKFKGPTTDFEFGVTQSISGNLGDSKSSNRARINSLARANWFNQRESQQFNKFVADNKDPDEFAFNFGEKVKTKKGEYTLRQLQDTAVENNLTIDALLTRLNK